MADEIEKYLRESITASIKEEQENPVPKTKLSKSIIQQIDDYLNKSPIKPSREKLYALNNLLIEWQRQAKNCNSMLSSQQLKWNFSTNLKKIQEHHQTSSSVKNENLQIRNKDFQPPETTTPTEAQVTENQPQTEAYRWSTRTVDPKKVHGLDEKSMSLQRLLVSPKTQTQFKSIAIVGMRGIGKTTLAQLLFSMPNLKTHFLPRIWVCLSKQPNDPADNRTELVKRMLICLGLEDTVIESADKKGLQGLLFALRLQLTGKRYLIVLDDVWDMDEEFQKFCSGIGSDEKCSEKLAYGLPKGGCGGTVIVTTRGEKVAKEMVGDENVHRLPLSDEESCWKIFTQTVVDDPEKLSLPLKNLKEIILKKCAGLPLAAKMMGEIARADLSAAQRAPIVASQTEIRTEIEPQED